MNVGSDLPFYSGLNSSVSLLFPAGDENQDFKTRMTVVVSNHSLYTLGQLVLVVVVQADDSRRQ